MTSRSCSPSCPRTSENDPDIIGTIAASAALTISEIPFMGPVAAVRVGRINGEFVLNPTFGQLEESELDLVVSGTRDAIMMVEAGAKILPEAVMAEAIMFGHRSLAPIIDLQDQLREQVGKAKRVPYIEPGTESVLDFVDAVKADQPFVVFDVETTSRDVKQGAIVEIGAVKVNSGKITDRWSTLVNPGIADRRARSSTASPTRTSRTRRRRSKPPRQFMDWAGDALLVGHNVGFDLGFLEAALGGGKHIEQGRYLDTLVLAREAYPGPGDLKLGDLASFFELEVEPNHRALPDAEATAQLLIRLGNDLPGRIEPFKEAVADAIRASQGRRRRDKATTTG